MSPPTCYTLLNGCAIAVLAADSMQERSGSFDLVTGAHDRDYDEICDSDLFRIIGEGDVWFVIRIEEFIDLACIHVRDDRRQLPGECKCKRQSDVVKRLAMQTVLSVSLWFI